MLENIPTLEAEMEDTVRKKKFKQNVFIQIMKIFKW